jgi:tetratricopeptide (TPR) repeat protein
MARVRYVLMALAFLGAITALSGRGQDSGSKPQDPSKAPDAGAGGAKKADPKQKDSATQNAPDQPMWDPLRADRDMEVGKYYMHKGDVDAAMDRFQDAIMAKPGYGLPFRMLGEAQEKKGMKKAAIKSYQRYLDLMPHAEDADKLKKKIEKLYADVQKEKKDYN